MAPERATVARQTGAGLIARAWSRSISGWGRTQLATRTIAALGVHAVQLTLALLRSDA